MTRKLKNSVVCCWQLALKRQKGQWSRAGKSGSRMPERAANKFPEEYFRKWKYSSNIFQHICPCVLTLANYWTIAHYSGKQILTASENICGLALSFSPEFDGSPPVTFWYLHVIPWLVFQRPYWHCWGVSLAIYRANNIDKGFVCFHKRKWPTQYEISGEHAQFTERGKICIKISVCYRHFALYLY